MQSKENISSKSTVFTGQIADYKIENNRASDYRLLEKLDGTVVLQGFFTWQQGWDKFGGSWKDITTAKETP